MYGSRKVDPKRRLTRFRVIFADDHDAPVASFAGPPRDAAHLKLWTATRDDVGALVAAEERLQVVEERFRERVRRFPRRGRDQHFRFSRRCVVTW